MKKIILRVLLAVMLFSLVYGIHYAWISFPIISGFDAKEMCSCIFISGRNKEGIDSSEFADFPLSLGKSKVDTNDSSVTTTIWGMAKKKAIYRKGAGCTLINDITEEELRSHKFLIPEPAISNRDSISWPYGDKIIDSIPLKVDAIKLAAAINKAFTEPNAGKKQRTRAVVIIYKGQLILEKYAEGFNRNTKMYGWSMAKSITGALIGTLVKQVKLSVTGPAPVPEWENAEDPRHAITLQNLLQQVSGMNFLENYTKASDVTNMLYNRGNMAAFTADHQLHVAPEFTLAIQAVTAIFYHAS